MRNHQSVKRQNHLDVCNHKNLSNRVKKKVQYVDCQCFYKLNKKQLVQKLTTPEVNSEIFPTADGIKKDYGSLLETPSPFNAS